MAAVARRGGRGEGGGFWNGEEWEKTDREKSAETPATGGAEGQVEVVAVYRGPGRWPTGRLWMDKFS